MEVADPLEALAAVKSQDIDLVVLHMAVDEVVRTDLPGALRAGAMELQLPVMLIAPDAPAGRPGPSEQAGVDDIISADAGASEMVARMRALLRIKEIHDQLACSRTALDKALHRERKLLGKLRRDNANLQTLATTDPLTHLQNVRSFNDILDNQFKIAKRYNHPLSLLMLDVDHFKVLNDTCGHPSGDYVLKELAVILKSSVRESDVVARTGGEEFNIILPKADRRQAGQFAERIRQEVSGRKFNVYGQDIHISISIGSVTYPADAEITGPELLVCFADQALLEAKDSGRDRVVAFHRLDAEVRRRLCRQYSALPYDEIAQGAVVVRGT